MTRPILLDASCLLAVVFEEAGAELVEPVLPASFVTAVNLAECIRVIDRLGGSGQAVADDLVALGLTVVPVGLSGVQRVSEVWRSAPVDRRLSLGDAICLAYGWVQEMDVWTADRAWAALSVPIPVTVIR